MNDKQIKIDTDNKNFKVMTAFGMVDGEENNTPIIVAGTTDEENTVWTDPHDVTKMAVEAVRDYMAVQTKGSRSVGIKWELEDNKEMHLILSIVDKSDVPTEEAPEEANKNDAE